MGVTGLFLVILAGLLLQRHIELSSLPEGFQQNFRHEKSETRLISQDEAAEIRTKSNNELPRNAASSDTTGGENTTTRRSDQANDENSSGDDNSAQFSAEILGADHTITDFSYNQEDLTCTVTHKIDAGVRTTDGPGRVVYQWKRSNGQQTPKETLHADRGDNNYLISHRWKITSRIGGPPEDKWVRFLMHKPASGSQQQNFEHKCRPNLL